MEIQRSTAHRAIWSSLTIVLLGVILAGCSDKRSDANGSTSDVTTTSTTTSTSSSTTPPVLTPTSAVPTTDAPVLTAYLAFWGMYIELGGTPPPFNAAVVHARLDELTTGAEKAQLFDLLQKNAATAVILQGDIGHSPLVASNDGAVAVVRDCMDDRIGVFRVADNSRVDTDDPARHLYVVSLRQESDRWRVETVTTEPQPCTV